MLRRLRNRFKHMQNKILLVTKYRTVDRYVLRLGKTEVLFSTSDPYSKSWFYPRYGGGDTHEPALTSLMARELRPSGCCLDIGAHIGYFSCVLGKLAPTGSVHAFEIDPKCKPIIERNVRLNRLSNVRIHAVAVTSNGGSVQIPDSSVPNPCLRIAAGERGASMMSVPAVSIDDFVAAHGVAPTLVKIDVEGAELKVLHGMEGVLRAGSPVLFVEVHPDGLRALGDSSEDLL
jgi:FkbM family methyltransferase